MTEPDAAVDAAQRQYRNRFSKTNAGIVDEADYLGVIGERAVCDFFGLDPAEYTQSERSTAGYFMDVGGIRIKAYATRHPRHIIVKRGRVTADAYVLVYIHKGTDANPDWPSCLAWAAKDDMLAAPLRNESRGAYAVEAHWLFRLQFRSLFDLIAMVDAALGTTRADRRAARGFYY